MTSEVGEVVAILRAIAEELLKRMAAWFRDRPRLLTAFAVLGAAFGLLLFLKVLFWLAWSPAGTPLGHVRGRVTLNKRPLSQATVEFTPVNGGPSYGITDRKGRYQLKYLPGKPGAMIGEHTVRITTYDWLTEKKGQKREIPEVVPDRYNVESTLTALVVRGSQHIDWVLMSP